MAPKKSKRLDYETKKKVRQYGKHAKAMTTIVKTTPVASHDLFEAVASGKQEEFLAAEEETRQQAERLKTEERERKGAEKKAARERARLLKEERQEKELARIEQEREKASAEEEQRQARMVQERRKKGKRLELAIESVATRVMRPPMSGEERKLLDSLGFEEKQKVLLEIAVSWGVKYDELAKYLGVDTEPGGASIRDKEKRG